jgi:hypothetical protein
MGGKDPIKRRQLSRPWSRSVANITLQTYTKWRASFSDADEFVAVPADNGWQDNTALLAAVALCIIISAMCGLAVMFLVLFLGLKTLKKLSTGARCCCPHVPSL